MLILPAVLSHWDLNSLTISMMLLVQSRHLMARDFHKGTLRMKNLLTTRMMSMNEAKWNRCDFYVVKYGRVSASRMRDLHSLWEGIKVFFLFLFLNKKGDES